MASEEKSQQFQIDLNIEWVHDLDIYHEGLQLHQPNFHIPDLNNSVDDFAFDLNATPNSSTNIEVSSSDTSPNSIDDFAFDLNATPNSSTNIEVSSSRTLAENLNIEPHYFENDEDDTTANFNTDERVLAQSHQNRKELSNNERRAIYNILLGKSIGGKLKKGVTKMVASEFAVSIRTVQRIWKQAKITASADIYHKKTGKCGRKSVQIDLEQIHAIPLHKRTTLESLASSLKINKTTLFRCLKSGVIRCHSNVIKPFLKEENMIARLQFCISMLDENSIPRDPIFKEMYNIIHIDEKWFYMTKRSENHYLLQDEEDPVCSCKSKNFIGKVMFLAAIARPRFDTQGNVIFDGKIGVFPFIRQEPAKRSSVNRLAGTLETKPLTSVSRDIMRSYLIEKLLPAIREKWPRDDMMNPIFIQQDNARTHVDPNDEEFCQAARQEGFGIRLINQPTNSPDLNVLDLGFFCAIQSLQHKESPKNVDKLINAAMKSYDAFDVRKSNRIFISQQLCMIEIMRAKGSHKYKIPHINKTRLENLNELPSQLRCDPMPVEEVMQYLN